MRTASIRIIQIIFFFLVLASCSTTKFVNDGEYLLDKVKFESDEKTNKNLDYYSYLRQQPNFKAFGLMKWQLYVYNWSGRNEKKWINKQLRRIGEAPVILDTMLVEQSVDELTRYLTNKGYLHAEITSSIDTSRYKKAVVTYQIKAHEPHLITDYTMNLGDEQIDSIARLTPPKRHWLTSPFQSSIDQYTSLVQKGSLFDRDQLEKERQRITSLLRRRGYYAFNRDYLVYQADTTANKNCVDLDLLLRPHRKIDPVGNVEEDDHKQYYIKDVYVVSDFNVLQQRSDDAFAQYTDTMKYKGLNFLYGKNGQSVRRSALYNSTHIIPGTLYNEKDVENTYSAYAALRALRNVNIRFEEIEENDTLKLNSYILTSPAKIQGFGADLEGTNSNGDLGFATSLSYQHRNLFKGAEVFSFKIRGAYESLAGQKGNSGLDNYLEIGGEASLLFPRFVFPFISSDLKRKLRATTQLNMSYNRQRRPEYRRDIFSGGWSYIWQDRTNTQARHTFKLIDVDYVSLPTIDSTFLANLPPTTARYYYSDQFIMGIGYSYSFNNYSPQNRQRNTHSLRFSLELAGNTLYGLSNLLGESKNEDGEYELFGINYQQFFKTDLDISKGFVLDNRNKIAFHFGAGLGVPYSNSKILPFERRYFAGGANSLRGWSVRTLGPGSMALDSATFVSQVGDIRLEANLEYRTKLFWKFEMAAYVDAGNIWTIRPYTDQKNGNFDFSRFYKEIAFSYGLGLRLDFDFFLIRLDSGLKAYDPQQKGSKKWAIWNPNLKDNFALHFAVGYPF
ncbi:BamA/TamA family outer membrane protein [Massilibacteroides sp.]|uniref:translocation and assembly module lipoprotein TamL n=1 Tax=Massilibacteroides sp. TaxID=2034766 RepID=UPI0026275979|nr:BamA/TamA family outer membrane protein [Massilibacteroides sp.]MDD4516013.1 BamA/TamA family outer membrane protein [Massilibacteroides sp.]